MFLNTAVNCTESLPPLGHPVKTTMHQDWIKDNVVDSPWLALTLAVVFTGGRKRTDCYLFLI